MNASAYSKSILHYLQYSTVRIECEFDDGVGTGTGFIFGFEVPREQGRVPVLITNKHVVDGMRRIRMQFHSKSEDGEPCSSPPIELVIEGTQCQLVYHKDESVDLCLLVLGRHWNELSRNGQSIGNAQLSESTIPNGSLLSQITSFEDILMIGYPNGIWDSENNLPVFRKGITATHPGVRFQGKDEFLIDAACYPGSSGSPVFLYNSSGFFDSTGERNSFHWRLFLIGILYATAQHQINGSVEPVIIPTRETFMLKGFIPNNLGYVISSNKILELKRELFLQLGMV